MDQLFKTDSCSPGKIVCARMSAITISTMISTTTTLSSSLLLPANAMIVAGTPQGVPLRSSAPASTQYTWVYQGLSFSVSSWVDRPTGSLPANLLQLEKVFEGEYSYANCTYRPYVYGQNEAVAVRERKGLKALISEAKKAGDGLDEFLARYKKAYISCDYRFVLRKTDSPVEDILTTQVQYKMVMPVSQYWFGLRSVAVGMNGWNEVTMRTDMFVSPRKTADTPISLSSEKTGRLTDDHPVFRRFTNNHATVTLHFLNKEGVDVYTKTLPPQIFVDQGDVDALNAWFQEHCDDKVWAEYALNVRHITGTTNKCELRSTWESTGRIMAVKHSQDALKEQLVAKVFHPARLEKMTATYGEDWMDRV